ncbi:MAG: SDR family oxidoreductase [Actinomycetota bacterium]
MTETDMTEQIALITGGSRGLGRSIALHLAADGVGVVITYLSREDEAAAVVAEAQALGVRAVALQLDTGDTTAFDDFAARFRSALDETWGRSDFDHLVNNAGIGIHSPFLDTTEEQFDQLLNIHLKGVFFLTQRLVPLMVDGGRIVNMSTGLARFSMPGYSVYGAAKGAVEVLTRYLAAELGSRGISVNAVAPGAIETDFGGGVVRDVQALNDQIASITAMGRVGLPDDVGGAVASLLTGGNQWITAQRIEISGGMNL